VLRRRHALVFHDVDWIGGLARVEHEHEREHDCDHEHELELELE